MSHLFEPFSLRGVTLRNRIGVSPMCQYSYEDGFGNDWLMVHLGARAAGGAGLVIAEATAVEARGRITPHDLGIWTDAHTEPLARVARFIKSQGAVAGIQIAHAGRKACTRRPWDGGRPIPPNDPHYWPVVGASPLPFADGYQTPQELSQEEIQTVQNAFRSAAQRALAAGFEWLEIHGAHGYLIHSFYSPLSNQRSDAYGGSFDNRIRFLLETAQACARRVARTPAADRAPVLHGLGGRRLDGRRFGRTGAAFAAARRGPDRLFFWRECAQGARANWAQVTRCRWPNA